MDYSGHVICENIGKHCDIMGVGPCCHSVPHKQKESCDFDSDVPKCGVCVPFEFQVGDVVEVLRDNSSIYKKGDTFTIGRIEDGCCASAALSSWTRYSKLKFISRGGKMSKKEEITKKVNNFVDDLVAFCNEDIPSVYDKATLETEIRAIKQKQTELDNGSVFINRRIRELDERIKGL